MGTLYRLGSSGVVGSGIAGYRPRSANSTTAAPGPTSWHISGWRSWTRGGQRWLPGGPLAVTNGSIRKRAKSRRMVVFGAQAFYQRGRQEPGETRVRGGRRVAPAFRRGLEE